MPHTKKEALAEADDEVSRVYRCTPGKRGYGFKRKTSSGDWAMPQSGSEYNEAKNKRSIEVARRAACKYLDVDPDDIRVAVPVISRRRRNLPSSTRGKMNYIIEQVS